MIHIVSTGFLRLHHTAVLLIHFFPVIHLLLLSVCQLWHFRSSAWPRRLCSTTALRGKRMIQMILDRLQWIHLILGMRHDGGESVPFCFEYFTFGRGRLGLQSISLPRQVGAIERFLKCGKVLERFRETLPLTLFLQKLLKKKESQTNMFFVWSSKSKAMIAHRVWEMSVPFRQQACTWTTVFRIDTMVMYPPFKESKITRNPEPLPKEWSCWVCALSWSSKKLSYLSDGSLCP